MTRALAPLWRTLTALRLAWRDLRREPRRGALVVAMVALTAAVVVAVGTVAVSQTPTPDERSRAELGQNEAWVRQYAPDGTVVYQSPTDPNMTWTEGNSNPYASDDGEYAVVQTLLPTDATVVQVASSYGLVTTPDRAVRTTIVAGETWGESFAGLYDLTDGVAPTTAREVLVSPTAAEALGLALGDEVSLPDVGGTYTVVGLMTAPSESESGTVFLPDAGLIDEPGESMSRWYLPDTELTWEQTQVLNTHGLTAYSRSVALDPPDWESPGSAIELPVDEGVLGAAGIGLVAVMLLAGSAFTVSFRRDQRQLALLAATGAGRASLVSVGVARGFLLGLAGGMLGAGVGLAAGWGWVALLARVSGEQADYSFWGYHWEPVHLVFAIAFGALTGAISSLIPALVAARLDVLAALRGARKPSRPRRSTPWWAAAFLITGAVVSVLAARRRDAALDMVGPAATSAADQGSQLMMVAFVLIFAGLVVVTPRLLLFLATLLAPLGVAARLAARDAARNAGRTVPVIAAIGATAAVATLLAVGVDREGEAREGWASQNLPEGSVTVQWDQTQQDPTTVRRVLSAVETALPEARATLIEAWAQEPGTDVTTVPYLAVPEDKVCPAHVMGREHEMTQREYAEDPNCQSGWGTWTTSVAVGGPQELEALLRAEPSDEALAALANGGVVALNGVFVENGVVELQLWDYEKGNYPDGSQEPSSSAQIPAIVESPPDGFAAEYPAMISLQTAAEIGYPVVPHLVLVDVDGGVTAAQEAELNRSLVRVDGAWLRVVGSAYDEGYDLRLMSMVLAAVLLAAGLSTAVALGLARADARRDDFTLAALGASPRLARSSSGWQAAIIVAVSLGIGLTSGTALGWIENHSHAGEAFSPPWLELGAALVAIPAVVGALAWLFTKAPKAMHYRLAA